MAGIIRFVWDECNKFVLDTNQAQSVTTEPENCKSGPDLHRLLSVANRVC